MTKSRQGFNLLDTTTEHHRLILFSLQHEKSALAKLCHTTSTYSTPSTCSHTTSTYSTPSTCSHTTSTYSTPSTCSHTTSTYSTPSTCSHTTSTYSTPSTCSHITSTYSTPSTCFLCFTCIPYFLIPISPPGQHPPSP